MPLSFDVTPADAQIITKIAERAANMDVEFNGRSARPLIDWRMDFSATHASGNPLRLQDLLTADQFNFAHDAFGIARHLNRLTGELEDCFRPRFSAPVHHPMDA